MVTFTSPAGPTPAFDLSTRKDWRGAFTALRCLLADANDTTQVFRIMAALNAASPKINYERLLRTAEGGRIAYRRVEHAEQFSSLSFIANFAPGSVGAAYRDFLDATGHSAKGLAEVSIADGTAREVEHPHAWFGRRTRDVHDIWHILTGYRADDPPGEACLVAFSYAQTGGPGWALIAAGAAIQALRYRGGSRVVRAIWEGYRHGRQAAWLLGEDYERLLGEPLDGARRRLGIASPTAYQAMSDLRL